MVIINILKLLQHIERSLFQCDTLIPNMYIRNMHVVRSTFFLHGRNGMLTLINIKRQLSGLVVERWPAALEAGVQTPGGEPKTFNIVFKQQKLSSLLIACYVKLQGALYKLPSSFFQPRTQ